MTDIDKIKANYTVRELLDSAGAEVQRNGKCKYNPLRPDDKTCSLQVYDKTNSFCDFGDKELSGDVIELYSLLQGISIGDAIKIMGDNIHLNIEKKDYSIVTVPQKEYMKPSSVNRAFESKYHDNIVNHKDELYKIAPKWLIEQADSESIELFYEIVKYSKGEKTAIVKLPDEHGVYHTFRYRRKTIGEDLKKWVALAGARSSYPYCRLTEDKITLIVEGTHDFLTAMLCGFSVIALPSSKFKLDNELLKDRLCVFIDDDDGNNFMDSLIENAICDKIVFNHTEFKKITKCQSKDFSDYLECFDNLIEFKKVFLDFIDNTEHTNNWLESVLKVAKPITKDDIFSAQNQEFLYDELIIKSNLTILVAPPGSGKTAFTFGMINDLLSKDKIDNVFIFDPDSPLSYVKDTVERLNDNYGEKFMYYNGIKNSTDEMIQILKVMAMSPVSSGANSLIVCDGLQFFANGTIGEDKSSKDFLELLKDVRNKFGATIVLLHHTLKAKGDDGKFNYIGSQFIETATDNMIIMGEDGFYIKKSRADKKGNLYDVDIDFGNRIIRSVKLRTKDDTNDDMVEMKTKDELAMDIHTFIKANPECNQGDIKKQFKGVISNGKIFEILKEYKSELWYCFKGNKNAWVYKAINKAPEVTEFSEDVELPDIF